MTTRIHSKLHPQAALPAGGGASLIPDAKLIAIYTAMLQCRILCQRSRNLAKAGKKRRYASETEAVAAAMLIDTQPGDSLISAAPHACAAMLKGVPLANLLPPRRARSSIANRGAGAGQVHLASGVLVAPLAGAGSRNLAAAALAAGCAFEARHSHRENVAIAFYEGAGAENSWREFFRFALAHRLPVILVRQSARPLRPAPGRGKSRKRAPRGLPMIPVDANDAVAIYRVAHEAIAHARRGSGPTLIDCVPLRMPGERRRESDCIARMERYLQAKGLRPERIGARVAQKFAQALDRAVHAAAGTARRDVRKKGSAPFREGHRKDR